MSRQRTTNVTRITSSRSFDGASLLCSDFYHPPCTMSEDNSRSPFPSELFADTWEASHQRMMRGCQAVPGGDPAKLQQALDKLHTGQVDFSELPGPTGRGKMISVPLQKLDKCDVCAKTTDLRLCSSCASVCLVVPFVLTFGGLTNQ